ncbi:MAG: putative ABC transporter ATP-binding protein YxlF [Firmicutes bacterium ADurb.Bin419]|nr:MAG: putative ABC transporter ATP-binding protein YxlF [Firmicutes bacterium ADurb.Bin419]
MTLNIERVSKLFGDLPVLDNIDLSLQNGIYGLLGPNGAGKTTLIRIMADLLAPTFGRVTYDGQDISRLGEVYRDHLGYLPQDFGIYPGFTAEKFLLYVANLKGLNKKSALCRTGELLELVGLNHKKKDKLGVFSGGERQRVGIAQALLNDPDILILDEPTSGLDPQERMRFRRILSDLSQNKTILLSTHIVSDVESIADRVIILCKGKVLDMKAPSELLTLVSSKVWIVTVPAEEQDNLTNKFPCSNISHLEGKSILRLISAEKPHQDAQLTDPNMEDFYLYTFETKQ